MPDYGAAERDLDQALEDLGKLAKDRATGMLRTARAPGNATDEEVTAKAIKLLQDAATDLRLALERRQKTRTTAGH